MALTLPVRFEAAIIDDMGIQAETFVYAVIDPTASFSTILDSLNTWLADLDACTDGQIIGAEVEVLPALPGGLKAAPVSGSRVEQTGVLAFTAEGDTHEWAAAVPALSNDPTVIDAGKIVLTLGSPVQVLAALLAGGGGTSLAWTNAVNQALTAAKSAFLSFRKHTHQMVQATYERG